MYKFLILHYKEYFYIVKNICSLRAHASNSFNYNIKDRVVGIQKHMSRLRV